MRTQEGKRKKNKKKSLVKFFKLKYILFTILVSGVQHSDSVFLEIILH